jgi:sugar/nucleoside kinase (ribokinase family)
MSARPVYHRDNDPSSFQHLAARVGANKTATLDILSVTALNYDYIYAVDRIERDHEVATYGTISVAGGSGANTAVALARLGAKVAVAGIVANDDKGRLLRGSLEQAGIEMANVITCPDANDVTGEAIVFAARVRDGGRMIVVNPGVNNRYARSVQAGGWLDSLVASAKAARIVHLSSFVGSGERELQRKIIASLPEDTVVSLNPGNIYSLLGIDEVAPLMARADIVFFYENHLDALLGTSEKPSNISAGDWLKNRLRALSERLESIEGRSPNIFVVKRSWSSDEANFLVLSDRRGDRHHYCSARIGAGVNTSIDTTGAGDAMAAGILYCLLQNADARDTVDFAYVMAMCASAQLGARAGLPKRGDMEARWREHMHGLREPPSILTNQ